MIQRFFCLTPPTFLVASGTLHLPIPHESPTPNDLRTIRRQLRDLEFHPEVQLTAQPNGAAHWIDEKRCWINAAVEPPSVPNQDLVERLLAIDGRPA